MSTPSVATVQIEPIPTDQRPRYLSPSSVSTFQQCPLRYLYSRIHKLPEPSTEAQILGSMTHEVLELLMAHAPEERTLSTARGLVLDRWRERWQEEISNLGLGDYDQHLLRWNVWRCVENYFALEDPTTVTLDGVECRLEAEIDGVPILGILDRWHTTPEGAVISDYKTGKVASKRYDGEKRQQLMIYVELHETIYNSTVAAAELIYLKNVGKRVTYEPTSEARAEMRRAVGTVWAEVTRACETGEFQTHKTRLCDWCAYKGMCPAWRKY